VHKALDPATTHTADIRRALQLPSLDSLNQGLGQPKYIHSHSAAQISPLDAVDVLFYFRKQNLPHHCTLQTSYVFASHRQRLGLIRLYCLTAFGFAHGTRHIRRRPLASLNSVIESIISASRSMEQAYDMLLGDNITKMCMLWG
jgi:hypothetical protein